MRTVSPPCLCAQLVFIGRNLDRSALQRLLEAACCSPDSPSPNNGDTTGPGDGEGALGRVRAAMQADLRFELWQGECELQFWASSLSLP
jgi:hypothetical protein